MNKLSKIIIVLIVSFIVIVSGITYIIFDYSAVEKIASSFKSVSLCNFIQAPLAGMGGMSRDGVIANCYTAYAKKYPEENVCSYLNPKSNDVKDMIKVRYYGCVWAQASGGKDVNTCFQINEPIPKSYCVSIVANLKNDSNICTALSDKSEQQMCLDRYFFGAKQQTINFNQLTNQQPVVQSVDEKESWKIYKDPNNEFFIKYPPTWTYEKYSCNLDGVAFCPVINNGSSGCGVTCSPQYVAPINVRINIGVNSDEASNPTLSSEKYREVYNEMMKTFKR